MASPLTIQYRRKREGKTDYRKRLTLLKSALPRLVVRGSNKSVQAQIVKYDADGDKVLFTVRATDLKKLGWKSATGNTPAAYLTGLALAHKAKGKVDGDLILDTGLHTHHKGGRLYALVKGAIDGGLAVRAGEGALPSTERCMGAHINESLAAQVAAVQKRFI